MGGFNTWFSVRKNTIPIGLDQNNNKVDKWVPHDFGENQQRLIEFWSSLFSRYKNDPFLHLIVTCGEKCTLYDNR